MPSAPELLETLDDRPGVAQSISPNDSEADFETDQEGRTKKRLHLHVPGRHKDKATVQRSTSVTSAAGRAGGGYSCL